MKTPLLSVSMIVKNEEKYLEDCLQSVKDIADEIVIVDTGSEDNTVQIAEKFDAKVYYYKWTGDFSEARNYALRNSTGRWVLYIDADERLLPESKEELKNILKTEENIGWFCNVVSSDDYNGAASSISNVRLFKNNFFVEFNGCVHEQIAPSLVKNEYKLRASNLVINHIGYNIPYSSLKEKAQRNLDLLIKEYQDNPSDYVCMHLAQTHSILGDNDLACEYFNKIIESKKAVPYFKSHTYRFLASIEFTKKNFELAWEYSLKSSKFDQFQPKLLLLQAQILVVQNRLDEALKYIIAAYQYNVPDARKEYILLVNWAQLVYTALDIAALNSNSKYYNYFFEKFEEKTGDKPVKLYDLIKDILNDEKISPSQKENLKRSVNKKNIHLFMPAVSKYSYTENFLSLLNEAGIEDEVVFKATEYLEENNFISAAELFYQYYLTNYFGNPAAAFLYISFLLKKGDINKIIDIIKLTEEKFYDVPEVITRLNRIKVQFLK